MKKIKLLAPIIGATATLGAVLPVVSCKTEAPKVSFDIKATNTSAITTSEVDLEIKEIVIKSNLDLGVRLTWKAKEGVEKNFYAAEMSVDVDGKTLYQIAKTDDDGFQIDEMKMDGVTIIIPERLYLANSQIKINVDVEATDVTKGISADTFGSVSYNWHTYKCLHNAGKENQPSVVGTQSLAFKADLTNWGEEGSKGAPDNSDPIYFIIKVLEPWQSWSETKAWLLLVPENIGGVTLGNYELTTSYDSSTGAIKIMPPLKEDGQTYYKWNEVTSSSHDIIGYYKFASPWNWVEIFFGQY